MIDKTLKTQGSVPPDQTSAVLGPSLTLRGELSANEDLLIQGQFDGNINLQDRCLTVSPRGQIKANIQARRAVIHGSVNGKVSVREKIEIRKTAHVQGDLIAASIVIEDGASFKGSIELVRGEPSKAPPDVFAPGTATTAVGDAREDSSVNERGSA